MNRIAEIAYQKSLGPFLHFYYGVDLYKCCDVFPKLGNTKDFKDLCYWKCPVCGRETAKYQMPWMASKEWQEMTKPFEQISIDEWIQDQKQTGWKKIPKGSFISWDSEGREMPIIHTVTESMMMEEPDVVCKGLVAYDGKRVEAYIGFKEWISGPGGIYTEYEAIQWKEKTT